MQARIEQGCLKLKADTDEEKHILRKFFDSFFATGVTVTTGVTPDQTIYVCDGGDIVIR
jgi:hypothetical protein